MKATRLILSVLSLGVHAVSNTNISVCFRISVFSVTYVLVTGVEGLRM